MHARVVSMPCWELFEAQPRDYRDEVLPPDVKARLSVEAGVELGWKRWVGDDGDSISIERFGASAPGGTVLEHFGYTADAVVARALALRDPRVLMSHVPVSDTSHESVTAPSTAGNRAAGSGTSVRRGQAGPARAGTCPGV